MSLVFLRSPRARCLVLAVVGLTWLGSAADAEATTPSTPDASTLTPVFPAAADAFGPFYFGMATGDAVAMAPGLDWYKSRDRRNGRVRSVTVAEGWRLGANNYDVTLAPGYYGAYELRLEYAHAHDSAAACFDAVSALVIEIERRYCALTEPSRLPEGALRIALGRESRLAVSRDPNIPAEVLLDVGRTPFVAQPTIAVLHHSLDAVTGLPPEGVSVSMNCAVRRDSGELRDCRAAGPEAGTASIAPGVLAAVKFRLRHLRFDPQAIDPNDPAPLRAVLPVRVSPSDRVQLGPIPATLHALREVRWDARPTGADLERACPPEALRNELQAVVTASCRIQPDLSAVCTDARVTSSDVDAKYTRMFEIAAYEVLTKFRAKSLLRDDVTPAVGAWFTGSVAFRIAD